MGTQRASNKDVLDAIAKQGESIDKLINVLTAQSMPADPGPIRDEAADTAPVEDKTTDNKLKVDDAYLVHQKAKAQAHADAKGTEVVLYCRVNKANETKIAYALRERYDDTIAKQPSHRGAVATFTPAA